MKFYSEQLKQLFNSEEELSAAEKADTEEKERLELQKKEKETERQERAKEVAEAYKAYIEAGKKYTKLKNDFIKDYHKFHISYTDSSDVETSIWDLFDWFFKR